SRGGLQLLPVDEHLPRRLPLTQFARAARIVGHRRAGRSSPRAHLSVKGRRVLHLCLQTGAFWPPSCNLLSRSTEATGSASHSCHTIRHAAIRTAHRPAEHLG